MALGEPLGAGTRRTLLRAATIALPPSVNNYWNQQVIWSRDQNRYMASRYVGPNGKAYLEYVRLWLLEKRALFKTANRLELLLLPCFPPGNRHDLSNRIKALEDAFKAGLLYADDKQIDRIEIRRGPTVKKPGLCYVTVREILTDPMANLAWIKDA